MGAMFLHLSLTLSVLASVSHQLKLVDNGYEDLLVEIEDTVPENQCRTIFEGIEETISRGSSVLYRATRQRAYFRNVVVMVPTSWSGSHCLRMVAPAPPPTYDPAIIVGDPHPVFGNAPWTLQEKGCGQPGKSIYMTPEFLYLRNNNTYGDPGRLLVHEWAKFRWGVFEEYGHEGDPIYPTFQRTDVNSFVPTGCSNVKIEGSSEDCHPHSRKCRFTPSTIQNGDMTSSLMYLHYLLRVTQFCDAHTHNRLAPTKQNALCGRRSAWEVMLQHEDFINASSPGEESRDVSPSFSYIRPSPRRYVIVIEDTTIMNVQKRWDFLRKAIRKLLVYDIPAGHEVGVVLFAQEAYVKLPLSATSRTLEQRQRVATASLPRNPSQMAPNQKCIACGLTKAIEILEESSGSADGGVIFLISSGSPVPHNMDELQEIVKQAGIQVIPVMYPVTSKNPQPVAGVDMLAQISGTHSFAILDEGIGSDSKVSMMVSLMSSLYAALRTFLPSPEQLPVLIHQKEYPGGISTISEGSFDLDETVGGHVRFTVTYYDLGHVGNMISLIDPSGNDLDSYDLQEEDGDVNMIFVNIQNAQAGRWSYRIENKADSHQSLFIQVLATPSHNTSSSIISSATSSSRGYSSGLATKKPPAVTLEAWTSVSAFQFNVTREHLPSTIYAKVWAGRSPVVGARVEAQLTRLGLNSTGSPFTPLQFDLFDNGNGDSDITRGDGIYSRHIPIQDNNPARYSLSVKAMDKDGKTSIVAASLPEPHSWSAHSLRGRRGLSPNRHDPVCCGSEIRHTRTINAGPLSRSLDIGIIDIYGNHASLGLIPPSKIGDFRVSVTQASVVVTFYWTSPGDQRDYGRASRYEVVFSQDLLATSVGKGEKIEKWSTPTVAGTSSHHPVRWTRHDGIYHVAIRAVSRSGRAGAWSNTVTVFVPPPATTTEINNGGSTLAGTAGENIGELSPPARSTSLFSNKDILWIVGAAFMLLIIVLVLAVYYMVVITRRRRHKEKKVKDVTDANNLTPVPPEPDEDTDSISKQPPESCNMSETPNGIQRPLSPIQSWPASKLLAEHERRLSTDPCFGDVPDLGVPYQQAPFYYHKPNGHYIEDTIPIDSGSMVSTQPSESLLIYKMDTTTDGVHPTASSLGPTPVPWEGQTPAGKRSKVPPPTLPKPSIPAPPTCTSSGTLGHERRHRNVTQV